jgi:type II secretory pathway component GspD/PulD (secretin)
MVITKVFRPDHVKSSELEQAIRPMLTQGISSVTADDRTNKLIITDLPEVIERIERLIREIDVQLFTRVFYIRHGDVADIASKIETYKSDPGTIEIDEKTHQIIVTDLLSNIKKMELLIDILDVGPEIVIYDVNNIGLDGEDLEDLRTIIDSIRTEDLLFEVNAKQGVFILEDVPEVHERVEQILAGFDKPVKQVLIQGEVLTTRFTRNFSFGLKRLVLGHNGITDPGPVSVGGGFRTIETFYPYLSLTGSTLSGAYLGQEALLEYEASFSDTSVQVLLQPRLLVKNQQTSRIFVGSEVPYLATFFNDNTTGATRSTTQQTVTDGLDFEITPSISNSYLIEMEISIDNDDAQQVDVQSDGGVTTLVQRDRQSVDTVLTIPSGQTRVIGGLITRSTTESQGGLPWFSKIPIVGALFGTQSSTEDRGNLQLFITPTIVEDTIPRPTGDDGKRGRLVTGYESVPGAVDLAGMEGADEEVEVESVPEDLLSPLSGEQAEEAIESLLRETEPKTTGRRRAPEGSSNYVRQATGGSATIGTGGGRTGSTSGGGTAAPGRPGGGAAAGGSSGGGQATPPSGGGTSGGGTQTTGGGSVPPPTPPPPTETRY